MTDIQLIDLLGGPARVAALLGYDKEGGTQRVHNWTKRGIPAAVKVAYPKLFMPELSSHEHPAPVRTEIAKAAA